MHCILTSHYHNIHYRIRFGIGSVYFEFHPRVIELRISKVPSYEMILLVNWSQGECCVKVPKDMAQK